jgi:hypothetical protein
MNAPAENPASAGRATLGQLALGLFISWQLLYLLGASFLAFWSACHPEPAPAVAAAATVADHWGALTGQWQGWALYGPNLPTKSAFVAVELRWENETVRLRSTTEPFDVRDYFRPFLSSRLSIYESYLGLVLWGWDAKAAAVQPQVWNKRLADHVAREWKRIHAYLRWRLEGFERDHPEAPPPTEMVVVGHMYGIPPPGPEPFTWSPILELPLARWRLGATCPADQLPIETYNLMTHEFDSLPSQP